MTAINLIKNNRYDYLLILLMASLVCGTIGNGLQPTRLFILMLAPFMTVELLRRPHQALVKYRYECLLMFVWFGWSLAFFYKAIETTESIKHLGFLFIHITGFFEVIWCARKAHNPQRSIIYGWLLLLIFSLPIAINELLFDSHITSLTYQDAGEQIKINNIYVERRFASVTFGNLNSYNTVLCMIMPFLFTLILLPQRSMDRILGYTLALTIVIIIGANSSRGAVLCLGMLFVVYIACYMKVGRHRILLLTFVLIAGGMIAYLLFDVFSLIIDRFSTQGFEDDGRMENIVLGTQAFLDSYGLGIGIGNYKPILSIYYNIRIPAPHNLFLEVMVIWGGIVFLGFLGMLFRMYYRSRSGTLLNRYTAYFGFTALVFAGIVDSNYIMKVTTWMFIVSLMILVDKDYNPKQ